MEKFKGMTIEQVLKDIANRNTSDEADEKIMTYILREIFKTECKIIGGIIYPTREDIHTGARVCLDVCKSIGVIA